MYLPPYMFFHRKNTRGSWREGTNPALHKLTSLNEAPHDLLPCLAVNVSEPDSLVAWLDQNDAALITDLQIFVNATDSSAQRWHPLFDKLAREATKIESLGVYWDAEWDWDGLGKNVTFVRGGEQLKVSKSLDIAAFHAKHWPQYLEEKLSLKAVDTQDSPSWKQMKRRYQRWTETLNPWFDNKEVISKEELRFLRRDFEGHYPGMFSNTELDQIGERWRKSRARSMRQ